MFVDKINFKNINKNKEVEFSDTEVRFEWTGDNEYTSKEVKIEVPQGFKLSDLINNGVNPVNPDIKSNFGVDLSTKSFNQRDKIITEQVLDLNRAYSELEQQYQELISKQKQNELNPSDEGNPLPDNEGKGE